MKKFFRLLFSRITIILLAILLQLTVTIVVLAYFNNYYLPIRIVAAVFMVLVLLGIINRDMQSEGKIPWVILVTLFPISGVILYFAFSRNYATFRERKLFTALPQVKLADENPLAPSQFLGQIKYLKEVGAPSFTDCETKYFSCGEYFWEDLLIELNKAEKFIFLEYFIVERGKMFDAILEILKLKISQGVEIRFLYDDVGSLLHTRRSFLRKINKLGIQCAKFGRIRPIVSAVYNNRDHRKICVIDGKVGYVGGINLADEYINYTHPYGYWKDTAVRIKGKAVSSLCLMFLQTFDMAKNKAEDFEPYIEAPYDDEYKALQRQEESVTNGGIVIPFGDGPRPIYNEYVARNVYLYLINQAEHDLYITTPYLIVDDAFIQALCRAAMRGVNVNVVIPAVPDKKVVYAMTKQSCVKLFDAKVKIYKYTPGFIHSKSIVADGVAGVVGTINLDYRSFVHHYECGVFMYDTSAVKELYDDVLLTVSQSEELKSPPKLKLWERLVYTLGGVFRPLL